MSEPYRGFVELPLALFQALQDVGTAAIEEAVKKATPRPRPAPRPSTFWLSEGVVIRALAEHIRPQGFVLMETRLRADEDAVELNARHECGAWWTVAVHGQELCALRQKRDQLDLVLRRLEGLGCYCVRRDPKPMHTAMLDAIASARLAGEVPKVFQLSKRAMKQLAREANDSTTLVDAPVRFMGIPVWLDIAVEDWRLETDS